MPDTRPPAAFCRPFPQTKFPATRHAGAAAGSDEISAGKRARSPAIRDRARAGRWELSPRQSLSAVAELRDEIRRSGKTNYRIGTDIGISISTVDRFLNDEKPATTDTFDALCEYFGLELAEKKPGTASKEAGKKPGTAPKQAGKKPATKRKWAKKSAE